MKVAFCLHHFLPDYIAGTEMYVFKLAIHLKDFGIDPVIVIPNMGVDITDEYYYNDIRVVRYAENSVEDRKMIMGKKKPVGLEAFVNFLKLENPDIVHFHELAPGRGPNIFHVESVKKINIPIILTFHLSGYTCIQGSLIYKDEKKCDGVIRIRNCTECVYHSKKVEGGKARILANIAMALFNTGINTTAVNNTAGTALGFPFVIKKIKDDLLTLAALAEKIVVLTEWYNTILKENGVPSDKTILIPQGLTNDIYTSVASKQITFPLKIVFIGRISELKGLHLLIEAVNQLPEDKIVLDIYGQENKDGYALECREKSSASKNIFWMGTIASQRVVETLSQYDVLCLPSTFSEMSPLVIQEAFAAGIPVLASDVYGNAEQVQNGVNGWLFNFKSSDSLKEKIAYLIDDFGLLEKAQKHLPEPNSFKNVAASHLALYKQVLAAKSNSN